MRRLAVVVLVGLVATGVALAASGDPQKKINPADQARARAMLLRKSDLGALFRAKRNTPGGDIQFNCPALDESDLTLTGLADSPVFSARVAFAVSEAQVYESVADARVAWKRGTSAAGVGCLRTALRGEFAKEGLELVSLRRVAFPRVSQGAAAFRMVLSGRSQGVSVKLTYDLIVLLRSRAEVLLGFGSLVGPPVKAGEVRLGRTVAARMSTAMRSA